MFWYWPIGKFYLRLYQNEDLIFWIIYQILNDLLFLCWFQFPRHLWYSFWKGSAYDWGGSSWIWEWRLADGEFHQIFSQKEHVYAFIHLSKLKELYLTSLNHSTGTNFFIFGLSVTLSSYPFIHQYGLNFDLFQ